MEEARGDATVAAIDAPGLSALGLIANLESFQPSAQTERVIARQTGVLRSGWGRTAAARSTTSRLPPGDQRLHPRQRRRIGALRARRSVHARRHLRLQRAQGPVRRRGRRAAGRQRRVPRRAAPAARAPRREPRSSTIYGRPTTPRRRSASPVTSSSSRRRRVPRATWRSTRSACRRAPAARSRCSASSRCTPPTRCWSRPSGRRRTIRSWSPARRSATTTRA